MEEERIHVAYSWAYNAKYSPRLLCHIAAEKGIQIEQKVFYFSMTVENEQET